MQARELMRTQVVTIQEDARIEQLCDLFQVAHVHGIPVLNAQDELVGIVSEEDVIFGAMGRPDGQACVRDIMTSPPVCANEDTDVVELCRMMWGMRIHHVPILLDGRVTGIVSSLDLVRAVAEGSIRP